MNSDPKLDAIRGAQSVQFDPRPEQTPFTPGNLACYDSDAHGVSHPDGIWEFDGNGKISPEVLSGRILQVHDLYETYKTVNPDIAQWICDANKLKQPTDKPIPEGKRVTVPVMDLKKTLGLLAPKLRQVLAETNTMKTADGRLAVVTGNVKSTGMPLPIDDDE